MPYLNSLDLANRACQHLGNQQILDIDEDSRANFELAFAYDKLREAELRRSNWRFAIRTVLLRPLTETTREINPQLWSSNTLYLPGAIVKDENGDLWQSVQSENLNYIPGQSPAWDQYFGPMTADEWATGNSYYCGDIVYVRGENSSYVVYLSLANTNTATPGSAVAWDAAESYGLNEVVSYGGSQWRSLLTFNENNTPTEQPAEWDAEGSYGVAYVATADDGYVYVSQAESNVGHYPPEDDGTWWLKTGGINAWAKVPTIYPSDPNWLPIYCQLGQIYFKSPLGIGVDLQAPKKVVYRLPCNHLRSTSRDPKAGALSNMGAPTGLAYNDWLYEGDYLLTREPGPLMYRFIADIAVVSKMDPMFCEALAARMALGTAETITSSSKKKKDIQAEYVYWIREARVVNGIEAQFEEAPEDDWVTCRA